jgi:hypothetical protein
MDFHDYQQDRMFRELWESVAIIRDVPHSLFTFGHSDLPYFLVVDSPRTGELVEVSQGSVRVTRPMIVTPYNTTPEFSSFFEGEEWAGMIDYLLARTAAFSNLKLENQSQKSELTSDSVEEVVARLNHRLDAEEEDRVAILTAPHRLGPLAVLRYTTERIMESAPGNIRELRERGFLPE